MNHFLKSNLKTLLLVFFGLLVVVYHIIGYQGHYGYDDLMYARLATDLVNGDFVLIDYHFVYRWSILGLTALSYMLFGITDLASAIPAMLVSLITLYLVYISSRNRGVLTVLLALALFILTPWTLFHTDKLMPDIYMALGSLASIVVLYKHRYERLKNPLLAGLLFSCSIFFGFLSKAAIILLIPVMLVLFISDIYQRRYLRFWSYAIGFMSLLLIAYLGITYQLTGSALSRIDAVNASNFFNMSAFSERSFSDLFARLTYGLPTLFTEHIFITALMFSIPPLLTKKIPQLLRIENSDSFYPLVLGIAFLSGNFMTTSFDRYVPMLAEPRHFLFLIPLAAIAAAPVVYGYFTKREYKNPVLAISVIVAFMAVLSGNMLAIYTYVAILIIVSVRYFYPVINQKKVSASFILAFTFIMVIKPVDDILIGHRSNYEAQKLMLKKHIVPSNEHTVVVTNYVQKQFGEYYQEYEVEGKPRWVSYDQEPTYNFSPDDDIYVMINSSTRGLSGLDYFSVPLYARHIPSNFEPIHVEHDFALYRVDNKANLVHEKIVMQESNDFEHQDQRWSDYSGNLSEAYYFSASKSHEIPAQGFSANFSIPLIQLINAGSTNGHISCSLIVYAEDISEIELVLVAEEGEEQKYWTSAKGDAFKPLGNNWWRVVKHEELNLKELSSSILKVYLWNRSSSPIFVDDFEITVFD